MLGEVLKKVIYIGSGKSAVFQLPTLASNGFALVISPLVSIIEDQVCSLLGKGIPAIKLTSGALENAMETQLLHDFKTGAITSKFLYVTPEKFSRCKSLSDALKDSVKDGNNPLVLIVLDEAHCYSEWGKYNKIKTNKRNFMFT